MKCNGQPTHVRHTKHKNPVVVFTFININTYTLAHVCRNDVHCVSKYHFQQNISITNILVFCPYFVRHICCWVLAEEWLSRTPLISLGYACDSMIIWLSNSTLNQIWTKNQKKSPYTEYIHTEANIYTYIQTYIIIYMQIYTCMQLISIGNVLARAVVIVKW